MAKLKFDDLSEDIKALIIERVGAYITTHLLSEQTS